MSIELKPESQWWYGRWKVNGKFILKNLAVKAEGNRPPRVSEEGDRAFEKSRRAAQLAFARMDADIRGKHRQAELVQTLHEIKYGSRVESFPVADLVKAWERIPRRRKLHPRYIVDVHATFRRFTDFLKAHHAQVVEAAQVDRATARAFMDSEKTRGVAAKAWNDTLKRRRATFRFLQHEHGLLKNPFDGIPSQQEDHVHRKPFTPEELKALLDAAKDDDFCRPLLVCGLSTAMRRGDCCCLHWRDVDLRARFITVKTSKTGETVTIPIFPMLSDELARAREKTGGAGEAVWPEQAEMQKTNPQGVTWRLRKLFAAAGFADSGDMEEETEHRGEIHADRARGLRRASVRDFHSFRVTWITLALTNKIPLEVVRRVTGHRTTEVVLKHYFQPGREQFRAILQTNMPALLTNGEQSRESRILALLSGLTAKNWRKVRDEVAGIVKTF